jgi:hypothetical protein
MQNYLCNLTLVDSKSNINTMIIYVGCIYSKLFGIPWMETYCLIIGFVVVIFCIVFWFFKSMD